MKRVLPGLFFCFLLMVFPPALSAQGRGSIARQLEKARESWERREYGKAEELAAKILKTNPAHGDAILLMADISRETSSREEEVLWLKKAADAGVGGTLLHFRLGEALFFTSDFEGALESLSRFLASSPRGNLHTRALRLQENAAFAAKAVKNPVPFEPADPGEAINTPYDEYWPTLTVDGETLLFTRRIPIAGSSHHTQEDFFISHLDSVRNWSTAEPLAELNTPANEGAPSLSADGRLLFFTLCNHPDGFGSCDIWFSRRENEKWTPPRNVGEPVNTRGWEGQPSLSAFGDFLYFSSERSGGKGKKDIWRVALKGWREDGLPLWGGVENCGDSINTPGDEISPFLHPGGRDLFFASDGWPGMGGYDLFRSVLLPDGTWSSPSNLGYPVNTIGNEQGLITDRTGVNAWMATGKTEQGNMDIFSFQLNESDRPSPVTFIRGRVVDDSSGVPVPARVKIRAESESRFGGYETVAGENGTFLAALPMGVELLFSAEHPGYLYYSEGFSFSSAAGAPAPVEREIRLRPATPGSVTNLYQILFATDQYEILSPSEQELGLLLEFLRQNRELRVEIGGHTDNTGSETWNMLLSQKRAESVREYLLERGVESSRISAKGYGMSQPVDTNESEEGRSKNRRTSILILP